ncbi:DUF2922 domain-containing protein [Psychrobacillus sp. BM2]|uniref:DUF2922 domain-containing protein n=1 Tax=Psychrobacillus sp. BM2 TaxID=3400421 RepID=UPI003B01DD3D
MSKTLQLQFETAHGKNVTISVDDPKSNLTETDIQTGMQEIISSNAFRSDGSPLAVIKSAKVVDRTVTEII